VSNTRILARLNLLVSAWLTYPNLPGRGLGTPSALASDAFQRFYCGATCQLLVGNICAKAATEANLS